MLGASRLNLFLGLGITSEFVLLSACVEVPPRQATIYSQNEWQLHTYELSSGDVDSPAWGEFSLASTG